MKDNQPFFGSANLITESLFFILKILKIPVFFCAYEKKATGNLLDKEF